MISPQSAKVILARSDSYGTVILQIFLSDSETGSCASRSLVDWRAPNKPRHADTSGFLITYRQTNRQYCPVSIELEDGRKVQYTATIQKGHAKNPLTEDEVLAKFRSNVTVRIAKEQGEAIIACVRTLETLGNVRELTKLLVA